MHVVSASEGVRRHLGEPNRADRARFDEARQFPDRVLDGRRFVDAMHIVQVDVVDAEPLPRAVEGLADMGRAIVEEARAVVASANGELGRERHPRAPAFVLRQELADHLFAEPIAIDVGGVPEIDAEIERPRQRPQGIGFGRRVRRSRRSSWRRNRRPKPSRAAKHAVALLPLKPSSRCFLAYAKGSLQLSLSVALRSPRQGRARGIGSRDRSCASHRRTRANSAPSRPWRSSSSSMHSGSAPAHGPPRRYHRPS